MVAKGEPAASDEASTSSAAVPLAGVAELPKMAGCRMACWSPGFPPDPNEDITGAHRFTSSHVLGI